MGLDMYAFAGRPEQFENPQAQADLAALQGQELQELHYWRKHHDLHGWMQRLYQEKGGTSQEFNCDSVRLTAEDLDRLEQDVKANRLPHTTGFFFGNYPPDAESQAEDLRFIANAREALAAGLVVIYDSWW